MWRLWNKLFGWDYIAWQNTCDGRIAKVRRGDDIYFIQYESTGVVISLTNPPDHYKITWLTCLKSKYIK